MMNLSIDLPLDGYGKGWRSMAMALVKTGVRSRDSSISEGGDDLPAASRGDPGELGNWFSTVCRSVLTRTYRAARRVRLAFMVGLPLD